MKLILGCDPLLQPLTGIGHYTQKLANGFMNESRVDDLSLFAHGKFFESSLIYSCLQNQSGLSSFKSTGSLLSQAREKLAKSQLAVKIYSTVTPIINNFALRNHQSHIFHSPNFILPNFDGKKVVTIHDLSTLKFPEFHPKARVNYINKAIENSIKNSDHIITDSHYIKDEILKTFSVSQNKITAVHLGADKVFQSRNKEQCLSINKYDLVYKKFFLFVSTIEPRKNIRNLLAAYTLYRQKNPKGLPLVLVGSKGWQNEEIQLMIDDMTSKNWVQYLGYVNQDDIPILYSSAKALLFPSIYEGFGLPVLEALQSGTPVLTSKNSTMSEITQNCAALVEFDDVEGMSQSIERLSLDEDFINNLVKNGLIRSKNFSWEKCVNETLNVYQSLV